MFEKKAPSDNGLLKERIVWDRKVRERKEF
jgi:hypothetical protein